MKKEIEKEFLSILEQNIGIIIKITNVYTHNEQDREDLMSDIIFELWKSFPGFKGDSKVSTWLYRVALNVSLKTKRKRDNNKLIFVDNILTYDRSVFINTSDDKASDISKLYKCIEDLNPLNKAIILLYLDEKSNEEIALITGLSRTNVSTRLNRIREQLKTCMIKTNYYGN